METYTMSQKELSRVAVFDQLVARSITQARASELLGLSLRQIKRKVKLHRLHGAKSLVHASRGQPSNNRLDPLITNQAIGLVREYYSDFKPTFAAEKLAELHGLKIGHETLRLAMIEASLWKAKERKINVHVWRERRAALGELVQADGSLHAWFEDRAPKCTLLAFIDDATSRPLELRFCDGESTRNLMAATDEYVRVHGRPVAVYVDRGGVYKVNNHNPDDDKITQYERALNELGTELIHARSPQAKGRVERLFGTLQDRLVKELRLANISTTEEANKFMNDIYLPKHNAQFAVKPREAQDRHRSIEGYDLDQIFVTKEERNINQDFTVQYHTRWFQLDRKQPTLVFPKNKITINEHYSGTITLTLRTATLNFKEIAKRPEKIKPEPEPVKTYKQYIPPATHPWRLYKQKRDISTLVH